MRLLGSGDQILNVIEMHFSAGKQEIDLRLPLVASYLACNPKRQRKTGNTPECASPR
jgi:hypothetical protein